MLGETSMSAFKQEMIPRHKVSFKSTSEKIAVTDAELIVSFTPETTFKANGRISVQVPAWFVISDEQQPNIVSAESMLDFSSEAFFESHPEYTVGGS